jgi:hypothetical protein
MSFSTCPIATLNAPAERVWSLLSEPASYALWWDAQTRSITPEGSARPGQRIHAQSKALGQWWDVNIIVESMDEAHRQIHLTTRLPFGITVHNHITVTSLGQAACRVAFG